jgi:hypothetical protein
MQESITFFLANKTDLTGSFQIQINKLNKLKVHKIENFLASDFGICVISLLVMHK